ncbi:serine/threonine-protein kinase [Candidatus Uabimicrobium amorphum]|uniref:Protein kinase n=1 Tax=Uabimicrobium amorphum TaxID=2596890 RepID=A0A5S9IP46_UABAM|nr:serine/threonine-protein kinase [Candidatus Uabimicrobium amorphum]BBM85513.1 protein kinase [Candidatus Uabimicrobium amorphum]
MNTDFFDEFEYIKQLPEDFAYEIRDKIGEGGMGEVYRALEKNSQRIVAIKFITATHSQQITQKRFLREAQLSAQLNHPNIIKVHNVGFIQNHMYIAMEYVHGKTLSSCLHELSLQKKLIILEKIARALHYAHSKGIVHRDIKPDNIIITQEIEPIVMDFGLAKSICMSDYDVTKTGEVIGTPRYMSIEQMQGYHQIDGLVDVYALGVILYEMITGEHMIAGDTPIEILYNLQAANIIPLSRYPSVAKDLQSIWLKATAAHNKRYKNAKILADDIRKFLQEEKVSARWFGFYHRLKNVRRIASIVLVFIIVIAALYRNFYRDNSIKIHITPLVTAEILINQKLYAAAQEQLQKIKTQDEVDKLKIYQKLVFTHVKLKQYLKAQNIFQQHLQNQPLDPLTVLAILEMYYAKRDLSQIQSLQFDTTNRRIKARHSYYQGLILYQNKHYEEALKFFADADANANAAKISINKNCKLFIARCNYRIVKNGFADEASLKETITLLKNTVKDFPGDTRILGYLGESYLMYHTLSSPSPAKNSEYLSLAVECFKTCIARSKSSDYYALLGKAYFRQQKYIPAYKALTKSIEIGGANLATADTLMRVLLRKPSLNENSMFFLTHVTGKVTSVTPPNLFTNKFLEIQETYHSDYAKRRVAMNNLTMKNRGGIAPHLEKIAEIERMRVDEKSLSRHQMKIYDDAISGLMSLRYHPQLQEKIMTLAQSFSSKKRSRVENIWHSIEREKTRENRHALYYQSVHLALQNNEEVISETDRELLKKIAHNRKLDVYKRYLAAKALLQLLEFSELEILSERFKTQHRDFIGSMIAVIVLREARIRKETDVFSHIKDVHPQTPGYEFLCALVAKSTFIYLVNYQDNIQRETWRSQNEALLQILHYLMKKDNKPRVQLYAAASAFAISKDNEALKILKENMTHSSPSHRVYAHYYFWSAPHIPGQAQKFMKEYRQGLRDKNEKVRATALYFLHYFNDIDTRYFAKDLESLIDTPNNIGLRAIFGYCNKSQSYANIKERIIMKSNRPFVQVYTYIIANFLRIFDLKGKVHNISRFNKMLEEFPSILQNSSPALSQWACWFFSSLNYYRFDLVEKHKKLVQNSVLVFMRQPYLRLPFVDVFLKQSTTREKLNFINKCLENYPSLRENAMAAKVLLSKKNRNRLYKQALRSKNKSIKRGAAIGFYSILKFHISQPQIVMQRYIHKNAEDHYGEYIEILRRRGKQRLFGKWLTYAIDLTKDLDLSQKMVATQMAKFYYERAVIYRSQNNIAQAVNDLQKAIELLPKYPRYRIELAELYHQQKNYDQIAATLPGLEKSCTTMLLNRQATLYRKIGLDKQAQEICKYLLLNARGDFYALFLARHTLSRAQNDTNLTTDEANHHRKLARKYILYAVKDNLRRRLDRGRRNGFWITRNYIHKNFPNLQKIAAHPQIHRQILLIEKYSGQK